MPVGQDVDTLHDLALWLFLTHFPRMLMHVV